MYIRSNKKGFTLIEVMIVLSIIVIGAGIIGSCILTSIRLGNNGLIETEIVATCNEINTFLKDSTEMSTEVFIGDSKPDKKNNWHAIWVEDGMLYLDDKNLYENIGEYGNLSIGIEISNAVAKGQITINAKRKGIDSYSQKFVIDYFNLENKNINISNITLNKTNKLWFIKSFTFEHKDDDEIILPEIPDNVEDDSTDYEILKGNSFGNTDEFFSGSSSMQIFKGSLIFNEKDGYWYQAIKTQWIEYSMFTEKGVTANDCLRKLDTVYDKDDDRSNIFYRGDIIRVDLPDIKGIYKCVVDSVQWWGYPDQVQSNWEKMPDDTPLKMVSMERNDIPQGSEDTVYNNLEKDLKSSNYSFKGEYDSLKEYRIGDIVKITKKAEEGPESITYYRKVFDVSSKPGAPDNTNRLAWKAYTRKFYYKSAYEQGDIVWAYNSGTGYRFKFLKGYDSIMSSDANTWLIYNSEESGWTEKININ